MSSVGDAVVGDVEAEPFVAVGVHVHPRMAGNVADVAGVQIAADVARRDADGASGREEYVGLILAHALRLRERLRGGGLYGGGATDVVDALMHRLHQPQGFGFAQ